MLFRSGEAGGSCKGGDAEFDSGIVSDSIGGEGGSGDRMGGGGVSTEGDVWRGGCGRGGVC